MTDSGCKFSPLQLMYYVLGIFSQAFFLFALDISYFCEAIRHDLMYFQETAPNHLQVNSWNWNCTANSFRRFSVTQFFVLRLSLLVIVLLRRYRLSGNPVGPVEFGFSAFLVLRTFCPLRDASNVDVAFSYVFQFHLVS